MDPSSFFIGMGIGALLCALILAFVVKDRYAIWFVSRANAPKWIVIPGVLLLGIALFNYAVGSSKVIAEIASKVQYEPWVPLALIFGIVAVLIYARRSHF